MWRKYRVYCCYCHARWDSIDDAERDIADGTDIPPEQAVPFDGPEVEAWVAEMEAWADEMQAWAAKQMARFDEPEEES